MPVPLDFQLHEDKRFIESHWVGSLDQAQVFRDYQQFVHDGRWRELWPGQEPHWLELANLTGMSTAISDPGWASEQASFFQRLYREAGIVAARVATLAPDDLTFGLSRVYQLSTEGTLPETLRVFRDRAAAMQWLLQGAPADAK